MNTQLKVAGDAILNGVVSSDPRVPGVVAMITDRDAEHLRGCRRQAAARPERRL